jgi:hypothetical protein
MFRLLSLIKKASSSMDSSLEPAREIYHSCAEPCLLAEEWLVMYPNGTVHYTAPSAQ